MAVYHLHGEEPLFVYLLVSVGTSLLLIVFLLLCGNRSKKSNKNNRSNGHDHSSYQVSQDNSVVNEEHVECIHVEDVESAPGDTVITIPTSAMLSNSMEPPLKSLTPVTTDPICENVVGGDKMCSAMLPNSMEPPRKSLTPVTADPVGENVMGGMGGMGREVLSSNESDNPYASVITSKTPVFECSGNSDSGNSIYAKVQDVPVQEETAYAVVELKDKDYDFVNGALIRRKVVDEETNESGHYDKPKSPAKAKISGEEIENSGSSGIYQSVSECKNENSIEISSNELSGINDSGIYDSCGPPCGPPFGPPSPPFVVPHRDFSGMGRGNDINSRVNNNTMGSNCKDNNEVGYDSTNRFELHPELNRGRGSSKDIIQEPNKCDKTEKSEKGATKFDKREHEGRFSKYLKFGHGSKKGKKSEDVETSTSLIQAVDIPVDNVDVSEGGAPPLPSVDKLMHISAHRKGQHSISELNPSPESSRGSSPGGSPHNGTRNHGNPFVYNERESSNDAGHNQLEAHIIPHHRPRISDGNIHDIPREVLFMKTVNHSPGSNRHIACDDVTSRNTDRNDQVILDNSTKMDIDINTASLISEPDYEEIETRRRATNPPVIVNETDFDLVEGYTSIEYGSKRETTNSIPYGKQDSPTIIIDCEPEYKQFEGYDVNEPVACSDVPGFSGVSGVPGVSYIVDYENIPGAEGNVNYENIPGAEDTHVDYENLPGIAERCSGVASYEETCDTNPDYAQIDFSRRDEERRIKDLYASVDFSLKTPREDVTPQLPVMYEGTYSIIPDTSEIVQQVNHSEDNTSETIPQCHNTEIVMPLYEELSTAACRN